MDKSPERSWIQRGFTRLVHAVNPDAARDRARVTALVEAVREGRAHLTRQIDQQARDLSQLESAIGALTHESRGQRRELTKVRHAMSKQRDRVGRLLRVAELDRRGLDAEHRAADRLSRLARSPLPIVVGPWTGEVGFELLYWIPFLQWVRETFPIDPRRLVVVSRGGVASWYAHVTDNYEDIFTHVTSAAFQHATEERKKQLRVRRFDKDVVRQVMRARGLKRVHVLHPNHMYALYKAFWRYDATVRRLEELARFRPLSPVGQGVAAEMPPLPAEYVAVRFYFSSCFPDNEENRRFARRTIEGLAARTDVVLLNNDIVVDDHRDFLPSTVARVHTLSAQMRPETNLAVQTAIISRARAFVGTYGGYSYLAPFYGVNAVAFYSQQTFKQHHLELAQRVFRRTGSTRLMPVDVSHAAGLADALAGLAGEPQAI